MKVTKMPLLQNEVMGLLIQVLVNVRLFSNWDHLNVLVTIFYLRLFKIGNEGIFVIKVF